MSDLSYVKVSDDKYLNLGPIISVEFTDDDGKLMAQIAYASHEEHRLAGDEAEALRRYLESLSQVPDGGKKKA